MIVDDQPMVREGFSAILGAQPDMTVVGTAADGAEAVDLAARESLDVILMDIRMPVMDGLEAMRRILAAGTDARIIILTTFDADEYVFTALRDGAAGFLLKDAEVAELISAVRITHAGGALLSPAITRRVIEDFAVTGRGAGAAGNGSSSAAAAGRLGIGSPGFPSTGSSNHPGTPGIGSPDHPGTPGLAQPGDDCPELAELTNRERDVMQLIASGRSNAEIGAELFLAEPTVKTHVSRILQKLGLRDRTQIVVLAYEVGAVRPGSNPV